MAIIFEWNADDALSLVESCQSDPILQLVERYIPAGARVLEAGCGLGRWVRFLTDRNRQMVGVELGRRALEVVKTKWLDLTVVQGDCAALPFPAGSFDGLLSLGVVEHWVEGPQAPLREIHRVLKHDGVGIITVPLWNGIRRVKRAVRWAQAKRLVRSLRAAMKSHPTNRASRLRQFRSEWLASTPQRPHRWAVFPPSGPFHEYRFTPQEFLTEIDLAGLDVIDHLPLGQMDGIYHELNRREALVRYRDCRFQPRRPALMLDSLLCRWPWVYSHMQGAVVRKRSAGLATGRNHRDVA